MTASIKVLKTIRPPLRWVPVQGEFTRWFLEGKSQDPNGPSYEDLTEGAGSVLQEAQRILGRCLPPHEVGTPETGLVVGYVQSGKTLSFETVIALARDNGYGAVIVLAGTKNNLLDQSEERLKRTLVSMRVASIGIFYKIQPLFIKRRLKPGSMPGGKDQPRSLSSLRCSSMGVA